MSREQDTVAPAIDRDTAETGRMRLRGVVDEAWRDIVSGTSHAFMLMLILAALVGGLSAAVQTLSVYKKSRLSLWKYLLIRSLFSVSSGLLAYLVFI